MRPAPYDSTGSIWTPVGAAVGVSAGCFAGAGYGIVVGLGTVRRSRAGAVVMPSMTPFAHDGALAGAFCGVTAGGGAGGMIAHGLSLHVTLRLPTKLLWLARRSPQLALPRAADAFDALARRAPQLGAQGAELSRRALELVMQAVRRR